MNYTEEFEKFLNKKIKYKNIPNKKRTFKEMREMYSNVGTNESFIYDEIENYIISNKAIYMKQIQLEFYNYLEEEYGVQICSNLKDKKIDLQPIERQLEILRNSQGNFKISTLSELFGISKDTIYDDLETLKNGIMFMETNIKAKIKDNKTKRYYEDTIHPLFLALNLTEVYILLKVLPNILAEYKENCDENYKYTIDFIQKIISRMKYQLSDYACDRLNIEVDLNDKELEFISETKMKEENIGKLMYLAKRGDIVSKILLNSKEYEGYVRFNKNDYNKYCFETLDGECFEFENEEDIVYIDYTNI